jgi:beta-lactamase regulating signal transducer with metallopeptidase domain
MHMPIWFSNLTFWSAQVALLVMASGFLPRLLQIRQPRVLLAYWRAILAISLALPFLQPWHRAQSADEATFVLGITPDIGIPASSSAVTHGHWLSVAIIAEIISLVILAGMVVRFATFAVGLLKLRQFRQASSPISSSVEAATLLEEMRLHVNTRAEFRLSAEVDSPVTFGILKPVILLPERFPSMDMRFQAAIACHELLHVRRRDWAHHLAEEIIRVPLWFHPGFAWLIGRVRLAREQVVDLGVLELTNARKPYLEALLEFTKSRAYIAAIPAPPFLVERQLVERVALMLKEVHMSRTRLVASLTAIVCWLGVATTFAVWTFPLNAAPRVTQDPPRSGATQGSAGGVAQEVANVVNNGVSDEATVERSTIWIDAVKKGPMVRQVRGLGTLVRAGASANLVARVILTDSMAVDVRLNQNAEVNTPNGVVNGRVSSISQPSSNGMRSVDIALDSASPEGVGTGVTVDGTIDIEKIENVLYVGRPIHSAPNTSVSLFWIVNDGAEAVRVNVKLGRGAVQTVEVLDGLKVGDKVILSDMSKWDNVDRIQIK